MLERPEIADGQLVAHLHEAFDLRVTEIAFLPLGADLNTAVFRARTAGRDYFVKLRSGAFAEASVLLPSLLADRGIDQVIPPIPATSGRLWTALNDFRLILYPYIEHLTGYDVEMEERHWVQLGGAVRGIHDVVLPAALRDSIRQEDFSPRWREAVRAALERAERGEFADDLQEDLGAYLRRRAGEVLGLIERAGRLAAEMEATSRHFVLCHSDLHPGNVLLDRDGRLYIVDWDAPILAPKERDLMYPGGAQGFRGHSPEEEERLFSEGYGPAEIDHAALAYYRYERIVEDVAIECEQIFATVHGEDRMQAFRWLQSNFLPGGTLEAARRSDTTGKS